MEVSIVHNAAQQLVSIQTCRKPQAKYAILGKGQHNTFKDAKERRDENIADIERSQHCRISEYEKLCLRFAADALRKCSKGGRCKKLYCHVCKLIAANRIIGQALKCFRNEAVCFLTVAPKKFRVASERIYSISPCDIKNEFIENLQKFGIYDRVKLLGFVEAEQDTNTKEFHFHFHAIVSGISKTEWCRFRKCYYMRSDENDIYRPMMLKRVRKRRKVFSYILKSFWSRVSRWEDEQGKIHKKKYRIRHQHFPRHILWQHQYGLHDIVLMIGLDIKNGKFVSSQFDISPEPLQEINAEINGENKMGGHGGCGDVENSVPTVPTAVQTWIISCKKSQKTAL